MSSSRVSAKSSTAILTRVAIVCCFAFVSVSSFTIPTRSGFSTILTSQSAMLKSHSESEVSDVHIEIPTFTAEEIAQKEKTKLLCEERNIPFDDIKNARDLSSTKDSPVKTGAVIRMGKVSSASDKDINILENELKVKTFVDLRSPTELKEDPSLNDDKVFKDFRTIIWKERTESSCEFDEGWHIHPKSKCKLTVDGERKERHFVSIMNEFKYVKGTLSKIRKRDLAKALLKSPAAIVSKTVRFKVKDVFLSEINSGGLPMLNELLLSQGAPGIKRVLQIMSDKSRHPIGFYCTAGKDRTGVIAAIILSVLGVADEDIIEDYSLSANVYAEMNDHTAMVGALNQRNLDPKAFLGAPPHVMKDTLANIKNTYGSVEGYLDYIGFGEDERKKLRDALLA